MFFKLINNLLKAATPVLEKLPNYEQKIYKEYHDIYEQYIYHTNKVHKKRNDDYIDKLRDKLFILSERIDKEIGKEDL